MQAKSPPRMQVVKREEKEAKLQSFIVEQFELLAQSGGFSEQRECLVVALSTASPVVRALSRAALDGALDNVAVRLIVADISGSDPLSELEGLSSVTVKWANNSRLLEAHEQLVLSESCSWTGDCMRREPSKRDAFECYAEDCTETASWGRTSFDRLWAASQPLLCSQAAGDSEANGELPIGAQSLKPTGETIVGTRH